ncbi:MAG: hypothetical protein JXA22_07560 [Candidatus Thermoplasmatota archaeon]|nr:hypothetical protein [Candidatus Thermoplasmatota archaeon]
MNIVHMIVILLFLGMNSLQGGNLPDDPPATFSPSMYPGQDWLLLVYMAGDNNLGRDDYEWGNAVKMDLEEMENNMPDTGLRILALADMEGPNNTYLYDLEPAPSRGITSPTIPLSSVYPTWDNEVDMSDWRTLREFLLFSLRNRTADRVMFVLWNHGAGWYSTTSSSEGSRSEAPSKGFAMDSNSGGAMFLDEFREAFRAVEFEIGELELDIAGFDTCSMGMMEVFYQVSPWFDLAIGSEDEQPWYGYNYTFVSRMGGATPYTPEELGEHIVKEFREQYLFPGEYTYATISLVNLSVLRTDLVNGLDLLSGPLFERMYQNEIVQNHAFRAVRGKTELLGYENIDLGDLLENLAKGGLQDEITDNATLVMEAYERAVLAEWHQPDGRNIHATGLSIYLPPEGSYRTDYDGGIGFLDLTVDTGWDEMIREFHRPIERVHVDLEVLCMDGDGVMDDLILQVTDPTVPATISGAMVMMNGTYLMDTDNEGTAEVKDLKGGTYHFEVFNGSHVGERSIRILNRAPVAMVLPLDPIVHEGDFLVLDAVSSYDPDGDLLTFRWDLDDTDGLDGSDSNLVRVNISFPLKGTYTVRLTVNDTELQSSIDVTIEVVNAPPWAKIEAPAVVDEDQVFTVSASGSRDSPSDLLDLLFLFLLDAHPIGNWTDDSTTVISIGKSGLHTVGVLVMDPEGAFANATTYVHVKNRAPRANITGNPEVHEDQELRLSGELSMDTPSDMSSLDFGWYLDGSDQAISDEATLTLVFPDQGIHVIELKVTDDDGYTDLASLVVTVHNERPIARITWYGEELITWEDIPIVLWGNQTIDTPSDLPSMNYSWETDDLQGSDLFGPAIEVSWPMCGTYTVILTVVDDNGDSDTASVEVTVLNRIPQPEVQGPLEGDEDEALVYLVGPAPDSPSDMGTLTYSWYVNGQLSGNSNGQFTFLATLKGSYRIVLSLTDDDGETGECGIDLVIRNPRPQVVLQNVPSEITEGKSFTALGFRSTDTPSDRGSLLFQWYLDGKEVKEEDGGSGRNLTMKAGKPGIHVLKLRVTDDEGDLAEAEITFQVRDKNIFYGLLDPTFSIFALILLIAFLLAILVGAYQFVSRVKKLPPPFIPEENHLMDPIDKDMQQVDADLVTRDVKDEERLSGTVPEDEEAFLDEEESDLPDIPLPEELSRFVTYPPPPDMGSAEIPEVDVSMFSDRPITSEPFSTKQ